MRPLVGVLLGLALVAPAVPAQPSPDPLREDLEDALPAPPDLPLRLPLPHDRHDGDPDARDDAPDPTPEVPREVQGEPSRSSSPPDAPDPSARALRLRTTGTRLDTQAAAPAPAPTTDRDPAPRAITIVAAAGGALLLVVLLRRQKAPDHPLRRRLWRRIHACPGRCIADLARTVDVDPSTVRYHVDRLEDDGRIESKRRGRRRFLHPPDAATDRPDAVLAHPIRRRILERLARTPRIPQVELRRELDVAASTFAHHARMLRDSGLVRTKRRGRNVVLRLPSDRRDDVLQWLSG